MAHLSCCCFGSRQPHCQQRCAAIQPPSAPADTPDSSIAQDAIDRSSVLRQSPGIDLATQRVGVFSKVVGLDSPLEDGDRVEIYRPLTADPKTIQARAKGKATTGAD
jgi:putative ubiquitin-RnfH superfamily antitoxin RatB of RatAB toxin-antitoxin module